MDDVLRVIQPLRSASPEVAIHLRADGGFGVPEMYAVCEKHQLTYTFGLTPNAVLKRNSQDLFDRAVEQYEATHEPQRLFTFFTYRAKTWDRPRTVIAKAECDATGTNLRFVVTNLEVTSEAQAEQRYHDYVQRGESEHRNHEFKNGLAMGRLSCHRFMANFWRLQLHVAAYHLFNAMRDSADIPDELRHAQPAKWRSKVFKVAARFVTSTRRLLIELPTHWPHWNLFEAITQRVRTFVPHLPIPHPHLAPHAPITHSLTSQKSSQHKTGRE